MMKNFTKLVFSIRQWPYGTVKSVTVDLAEDTIELRNNTAITFQRGKGISQIAETLRRCKLDSWTSMESPVLEGTFWDLKLYDREKMVRSVCGTDRFPPRFNEFLQAVTPCFDHREWCWDLF